MKNAHKVRSGTLIGEQRALDIMEVALHRKGWGYDRISDLLALMTELDAYYAVAWDTRMESDFFQAKLDAELKDILKDRQELIPFEKRYPEVRQLGYNKLPRR